MDKNLTLPGNIIAVLDISFKMVLMLHLYHIKSQFYNLFIKLVTGFWGHVWPNVYNLYISESLSLFKQ